MKNTKIEDKIFLGLILLIITGGFTKPLISSRDINYNENRKAYQIPKLNISDFISKQYQDDMEKAFSDQIPLANKMKNFTKNTEGLLKKYTYNLLQDNIYFSLNKDLAFYKKRIVYKKYDLEDIKDLLDIRATKINSVANYSKAKFYSYFIERDRNINFLDNKKDLAYEYFYSKLNSKIAKEKFSVDSFEDFSQYFYETDHHWNYIGSYKAYKEVLKLLEIDDEPIKYDEEMCLKSTFSGSKAIAIGSTETYKEQLCIYKFNFKEHTTYINNELVDDYGYQNQLISNQPQTISYGYFYGGDDAVVLLDFKQKEKENLLMIGESYDNAINLLIASHFNKTYNIDLRYYYPKGSFNIKKFIEENNIDKVLFIGNVDFYISEDFDFIESGGY